MPLAYVAETLGPDVFFTKRGEDVLKSWTGKPGTWKGIGSLKVSECAPGMLRAIADCMQGVQTPSANVRIEEVEAIQA